jgi:hypothetical protein
MSEATEPHKPNRYAQIIERIFFQHYQEGAQIVEFTRNDIEQAARALHIALPKNVGDVLYTFRYRGELPEVIRQKVPEGLEWIIRPAGRARYRFVAVKSVTILPNEHLLETKFPDATPSIVVRYALTDEQALLAKVRYNRLIDIFTGVTCYSLQNHLRTTVPDIGQVETDEVYVGIDRRGVQYIFPIQAKGRKDRIGIVQIEQDFELCAAKFPDLLYRPVAAQFMAQDIIALFEFARDGDDVKVVEEKHYHLVSAQDVTSADLQRYRGSQSP